LSAAAHIAVLYLLARRIANQGTEARRGFSAGMDGVVPSRDADGKLAIRSRSNTGPIESNPYCPADFDA
jgi:hypothetical protein